MDRTDDDIQQQTARAGAQAKGGIDPQPGDPTSPAAEQGHQDAERSKMREQDFGDHKGREV